MTDDLKGTVLKKKKSDGLFKKILSAYMENTLNGEKNIKTEHISVKRKSLREKFWNLSFHPR